MTRVELRFLMRRLLHDELHERWPDNTRLDAELFVAMKSVAREYTALSGVPFGYATEDVVSLTVFPNFVDSAALLMDSMNTISFTVSSTGAPTIRVPFERLHLYESAQTDRGDWIYSTREGPAGVVRFEFPVAHASATTFKWEYSAEPSDFVDDTTQPALPKFAHELIGARAALQLTVGGHPNLEAIRLYAADLHNRFISSIKVANGGVDIHTPDVDVQPVSNV